MLVQKFGGASLQDAASVRQVAQIIKSAAHQKSVAVVVSATGDTTDLLVEVARNAERRAFDRSRRTQLVIAERHEELSSELLTGSRRTALEEWMSSVFRALHVQTLEVASGERQMTPELRDQIISLGEQLSSRLVASVLREHGITAGHMDARDLIVTNDQFGAARPLLWESYARIRWQLGFALRRECVVLGGFIGRTENGRTTTLGRGGSDFTAAIIAAGLNSEELQVWKDVEGVLTWHPRLKPDALVVKELSYGEAAAMARAGAEILHSETMEPVRRLRIPVRVKQFTRPEGDGSLIGFSREQRSGTLKTVICLKGQNILALRRKGQNSGLQGQLPPEARIVQTTAERVFVALPADPALDWAGRAQNFSGDCLEVTIWSGYCLFTLVGENLGRTDIRQRLQRGRSCECLVLPHDEDGCALRVLVPEEAAHQFLDSLQRDYFPLPVAGLFAKQQAAIRTYADGTRQEEGSDEPTPSPAALLSNPCFV